MSASVQIALWGVAAALPVVIAYAHHRLPAMGLGTMLVLGWCVGRLSGALLEPTDAVRLYPVMDALFGALAFLAWRQKREAWKLVLVGLFMTQCTLHAAFWLAYPVGGIPPEIAQAVLFRYIVANNMLFASELICVAWAGGVDEWGRRARALLFGRPGALRHVGPAK